MDEFLRYWFGGFNTALQQLDPTAVEVLLTECGKACSASYPKQVYVDAHQGAVNFDDFLIRLEAQFSELELQQIRPNVIQVIYHRCACDLVINKFVSTPKFCNCSKQSLQDVWETIFGEGNIEVIMNSTILGGDDRCEFHVTIKH